MDNETRTVRIEYFAQFREERGVDTETVETTSRTTRELFEELTARHRFRHTSTSVRVAVNESFSDWDREIREGDTVVFLTPFGGG